MTDKTEKRKASIWMAVSGLVGFSLFLIANLTNILTGLNLVTGLLQLSVNLFVFLAWKKGFLVHTGFKKFVAFWGIVVPIIMATITTVRVLIPAFITAIAK